MDNTQAIAKRLRALRIEKGYETAVEFARRHDLPQSTYLGHENGTRKPKLEALQEYAKALKVPVERITQGVVRISKMPLVESVANIKVLGLAQAGLWLETDGDAFSDETIPVAADKRFNLKSQFALKIIGNSMNKVFMPNDYIVCVAMDGYSRDPEDGDIVVVERRRAGLVETTVKRLKEGKLCPESTDAKYQAPIDLSAHEDDTEVAITAIVVGSYRKF